MATASYTYSQFAAGISGFLYNAVANRKGFALNTIWSGIITGTEAWLNCVNTVGGTGPYAVYIDGTLTEPALEEDTYAGCTLFTGLSDTAHFVDIICKINYENTGQYIDMVGTAFTVDGASPSCEFLPADFATDPSFAGKYTGCRTTPLGSNYDNGTWNNPCNVNGIHGWIRFSGNIDTLYLLTSGTECYYSIDGGTKQYVAFTESNSPTYGVRNRLCEVATGLSGTHTYAVWPADEYDDGYFLSGVLGLLSGSKATLSAPPISNGTLAQTGDSQTVGQGELSLGPVDTWQYAMYFNYEAVIVGIPGYTTSDLRTWFTGTIINYIPEPDKTVIAIGYNDTAGSAFQTAYEGLIGDIQTYWTSTKILCRDVCPFTNPASSPYTAYVAAAVAAVSDPDVVFKAGTDWTGLTDGHFSDAEYTIMAGYEETDFADFFADGAISGSTAGIATVTGTLTGTGAISGTSAGIAAATATLSGTGSLSGAAAGECNITAVLTGTGSLVGQADGTCEITAVLSGLGELSGLSEGSCVVTGTLVNASPEGNLQGSAAGTCEVTGTLQAVGALSGQSIGTAEVTGTLSGLAAISGSAAGQATVTGTMRDGSVTISGKLTITFTARKPGITATSRKPYMTFET